MNAALWAVVFVDEVTEGIEDSMWVSLKATGRRHHDGAWDYHAF